MALVNTIVNVRTLANTAFRRARPDRRVAHVFLAMVGYMVTRRIPAGWGFTWDLLRTLLGAVALRHQLDDRFVSQLRRWEKLICDSTDNLKNPSNPDTTIHLSRHLSFTMICTPSFHPACRASLRLFEVASSLDEICKSEYLLLTTDFA